LVAGRLPDPAPGANRTGQASRASVRAWPVHQPPAGVVRQSRRRRATMIPVLTLAALMAAFGLQVWLLIRC
jgi:hypothetical protein